MGAGKAAAQPNPQLIHADLVIETVKDAGSMTVIGMAKATGVRVNDVIAIVMAEDGKRLRQAKRRREVVHILWEAV